MNNTIWKFFILIAFTCTLFADTVNISSTQSEVSYKDAIIDGNGAKIDPHYNCVSNYNGLSTTVSWTIKVEEIGQYKLSIMQAAMTNFAGSSYEVSVNNKTFSETIKDTSTWVQFQKVELGKVTFKKPGVYTIKFVPKSIKFGYLGNIQSFQLEKTSFIFI